MAYAVGSNVNTAHPVDEARQRLLGYVQSAQAQQAVQAPPQQQSYGAGASAVGAQPQAYGAPQAAPQGMRALVSGAGFGQHPNPYGDLSPADQSAMGDYNRSLYAGPDYKGRHEANQFLESQQANLYRQFAREAPIDYSQAAPIHDQFSHERDRLTAMLAARGIGGSGIEAGAQASLGGQEAATVGDFIRQLLEQRRKEHLARQMGLDSLTQQVGLQGLTRNWDKQDSPNFGQALLGLVGGVVGEAAPSWLERRDKKNG